MVTEKVQVQEGGWRASEKLTTKFMWPRNNVTMIVQLSFLMGDVQLVTIHFDLTTRNIEH